ncbi:helix-turn-helix domain-containing protein [Anaerotignum propionicum]|uniref:helix-turn-helix domain-containing protein n=1 Tax=Anaerotignum propionicum TaxID=28446 RepID=UPI002109274E|nr:helix-turn-helix transcriptional regulator [Anaerotignum propionicum]MCQ4936393.1 helix-turn-helix transcriptional regulator [Anaerotignum propionicum]
MQGSGISSGSHLKNENTCVDLLVRICGVSSCNFGDIMEYVPDKIAVIESEPGNR